MQKWYHASIDTHPYFIIRVQDATATHHFTIDGNADGIGNNETMLRLVALEDEAIMPGGLTMTEAYIVDAVRTPRGIGKPGKGALAQASRQAQSQ